MPKYKVQFELRTEGLDAPEEELIHPEWNVVERDAWMNLTEIVTVELEAESIMDAKRMITHKYPKAFDVYVWEVG